MINEQTIISAIARKRYYYEMTLEDIAADMNIGVKAVRRYLKKAKDTGLTHILVVPPMDFDELSSLEIEIKAKFALIDVFIVRGDESVMDQPNSPEKEAVLLFCCRKAAVYLTNSLRNGDILAVPWGTVASYVARQIDHPKNKLNEVIIVPMVGVMGTKTHPYEANLIAAKIAAALGGKSLSLAAPAIVDPSQYQTICQIQLVKEVLAKVKSANIALTPIAKADAKTSTVIDEQVVTTDEVKQLVKRGAVGEIASHWWFDKDGKLLPRKDRKPIGLGLKGFYDIVLKGGRVVAVVAASRERIRPTKVALKSGFVNVLITDHVTAQGLLKD